MKIDSRQPAHIFLQLCYFASWAGSIRSCRLVSILAFWLALALPQDARLLYQRFWRATDSLTLSDCPGKHWHWSMIRLRKKRTRHRGLCSSGGTTVSTRSFTTRKRVIRPWRLYRLCFQPVLTYDFSTDRIKRYLREHLVPAKSTKYRSSDNI